MAAGDVFLSDAGLVLLDDSGAVILDDGAGNACYPCGCNRSSSSRASSASSRGSGSSSLLSFTSSSSSSSSSSSPSSSSSSGTPCVNPTDPCDGGSCNDSLIPDSVTVNLGAVQTCGEDLSVCGTSAGGTATLDHADLCTYTGYSGDGLLAVTLSYDTIHGCWELLVTDCEGSWAWQGKKGGYDPRGDYVSVCGACCDTTPACSGCPDGQPDTFTVNFGGGSAGYPTCTAGTGSTPESFLVSGSLSGSLTLTKDQGSGGNPCVYTYRGPAPGGLTFKQWSNYSCTDPPSATLTDIDVVLTVGVGSASLTAALGLVTGGGGFSGGQPTFYNGGTSTGTVDCFQSFSLNNSLTAGSGNVWAGGTASLSAGGGSLPHTSNCDVKKLTVS